MLKNMSTGELQLASPGMMAEKIRKSKYYREAKQLFVSPAEALLQIRINALVDGKEIIMPAPGLKDGFFLLKPYTVSFQDLSFAVTYKGLERFGRRLQLDALAGLQIDMFITDALAVNPDGYFLGDGKGYFDLAYALLQSQKGLAADHLVVVLTTNLVKESFEPEPWDIRAGMILIRDTMKLIDRPGRSDKQGDIFWDQLTLKRIKKITPLWKLYNIRTA